MNRARIGLVLVALAGFSHSLLGQSDNPDDRLERRRASAEAQSPRPRPSRPDPLGAWLRYKGVQLTSTEAGATTTDLPRISPWIASADIVALGDGTHGTHEYYTVKQRLIEYLAGADGFRAVAFEGPWSYFSTINEYIQGGAGDPATMLKMEAYFFWDYEEMRELLVWARAYNASRPPEERIEFIGFDVYSSRNSVSAVLSFLEIDPAARSIAEREYACISGFPGASTCPPSLRVVGENLDAKKDQYVAATSLRRYLHARHTAEVIEQSREIYFDPKEQNAVRDALMAENAEWIQTEWLGGRGLLLWGHNEHVGTIPYYIYPNSPTVESMGQHLSARYGSRYFSIGTCMGEGELLVFDTRSGTRIETMQPYAPDNYESLFRQAGFSSLAIPLFEPDIPAWLRGPARLRFGTASYSPSESDFHNPRYSLPEKFDAIIYIEKTTPTQPLP